LIKESDTPGYRLLSVFETLRRISGALNPQIPSHGAEIARFSLDPRELDDGNSWVDSGRVLRSVPHWVGEAGAVFNTGTGNILVWLAPRDGRPAAFPSQLVMDLEQNHHFVTTWDTGKCHISGAEVCSGIPLVAGPPFDSFPIIVAITESDAGTAKPAHQF